VASRVDAAAPRDASVPVPRLRSVVRTSLTDFYFHSLRLVPANVIWGAAALLLVVVAFSSPVAGLLLASLLAVPAAGIFRLAAGIVRGEPDGARRGLLWPGGRVAGTGLLLGALAVVASLVLATNVVLGVAQGGPPGLVLATLAGWGLVAVWCGTLVAWPIFLDPARLERPIRDRAALTATLLLVDPVRFGGLGLVVALIVLVSVVLTAAILTVSISFVALIACRAVYPVADRLDGATVQRRP
jgi:hypothetical protein